MARTLASKSQSQPQSQLQSNTEPQPQDNPPPPLSCHRLLDEFAEFVRKPNNNNIMFLSGLIGDDLTLDLLATVQNTENLASPILVSYGGD
ncbi:hypothetical protein BOTCAL_0312g00020 [Botryotinia calthae]|uniref:Uncharacterized protein n=1 Tax=Botryotinia calthae TaxID=38488 RepID=A0A4Y8CW87_9HELO|nr:hypothetical protein BOTCAL_0312g00020 [Botryotinia calthae]